MGVDDYIDSEAGIIAAATAAAVSPRARELFRRGAVYGLAGVLKAGDVAAATARGAVRGAKDGAASVSSSSRGQSSSRTRSQSGSRSASKTPARSRRRSSGAKSS